MLVSILSFTTLCITLCASRDRSDVAGYLEYLFDRHGININDPNIDDLLHEIVDFVQPPPRRRNKYHHNYRYDKPSQTYRYQRNSPQQPVKSGYLKDYSCGEYGCKPWYRPDTTDVPETTAVPETTSDISTETPETTSYQPTIVIPYLSPTDFPTVDPTPKLTTIPDGGPEGSRPRFGP